MARAYCYKCNRAQSTCICEYITPINNRVRVIVLQHPEETRQAKGTAIIAALSLSNVELWVGEDFTHHQALNDLLLCSPQSSFLVYPEASNMTLPQLSEYYANGQSDQDVNLIFIDATWRKAKKIFLSSANLSALPRVTLGNDKQSTYRIRKVPASGYLSTIEAIAYSLMVLEQDEAGYQPLLQVFDKLINQQIDSMGEHTYKRHYESRHDE